MRILWQYLRPMRGLVALSLLLAGAAQALTLADPVIFGRIIDEYAINPTGKSEAELVRGSVSWLLLAAAVAIGARLAKALQDYCLRLAVQRFGLAVFNDGLKQTLRLNYQEYEDRSSGETVALLQKVRNDTERFITGLVNVLFSSLVGLGFLAWYAATRHWLLLPVFGFGVVVLGAMTGLLSRKIKTVQRTIVGETARMAGAITESLRNIELIKSLGLTFPEAKRLQGYTQRIFDLEMTKVRRVRSLTFLQGTMINLLKHSILFILLWLIFRQALTPGELISMQVIIAATFAPLQDMGSLILNYREAEASLTNFAELMAKPIEKNPDEPVDIGQLTSLRFEQVIFRHRSAKENSIDGISFAAELGQTIAFVGPSGSGKSTLMKLLVGLYRPQSGRILIDDVPTGELRFNRIRRQIGFVTQDPQLFSGSIRENLLLVEPDATDEQMFDALRRASATRLVERGGAGLETRIGESGLRLSGGERQRIAIARALLRRPRLFIFDEATSALDSITEQEITASVREISARKEQIVILIAHRLSTIVHADRIFVLERGRIVESGRHEELVAGRGLYYAMWRQQIGEREKPTPPAAATPSLPELAVEEPIPDETPLAARSV